MDLWAVSCERGINPSRCIKYRNFLTIEQLLVYQELLCSIGLVRDDSRFFAGTVLSFKCIPFTSDSSSTDPRAVFQSGLSRDIDDFFSGIKTVGA